MMAQVQRVDGKSLWAKGLQTKTPQKESYVVDLTAKDLSIVWGSDARYWKWVSIPDPNRCGELLSVAELIEVCWLQIDGKYPAKNLVKGQKYEVHFIVELKNDIVMNGPVTLQLTCPDGSTQEHQEDLTKKPKNEWIGLRVGEFDNMTSTCDKNVKFSLNGCDGTTWKQGLTVIGAVISAVLRV